MPPTEDNVVVDKATPQDLFPETLKLDRTLSKTVLSLSTQRA